MCIHAALRVVQSIMPIQNPYNTCLVVVKVVLYNLSVVIFLD